MMIIFQVLKTTKIQFLNTCYLFNKYRLSTPQPSSGATEDTRLVPVSRVASNTKVLMSLSRFYRLMTSVCVPGSPENGSC